MHHRSGLVLLKIIRIVASAVALAFVATLPDRASAADVESSAYLQGVVAADHPLASEAGAAILRQGGNVVDAAVATSFALAVVRPESCGLGGGGFLVYWDAQRGRAFAIDYRERAPAAATREMFLPPSRDAAALRDDRRSREGGLAVGVPGEVAGLCHALREYGTLDLATVIAPALRLAREGVPADEFCVNTLRDMQQQFREQPHLADRFAPLWQHYLRDGKPVQVGDRLTSPLAPVLERIAATGQEGFYRGPVAEAIVAAVAAQGGVLTLDDLADMRPAIREPLTGRWGECDVVTMPPPSSGGVALLEMLNMVTAWEQTHPDQRLERLGQNGADYVHLLVEAEKHAFADRAEWLGDADFADVPVARLTSAPYAAELAMRIDPARTLPSDAYGRFVPREDAGTSHFSVMDAAGNAVACTETVNTTFGSLVVEPRFGIVLNNEMDDFAAVPGEPNAFGLIQGEANSVAPGKKPLSSMTPTILVRDGKAVHAAGASGGPRIISATLQTLLNLTRLEMTPQQAVAAPRFHHQWLPDELRLERPLTPLEAALAGKGHRVVRSGNLASAQAASRTPEGRLLGGCDPRKGGRPAGH